jgi:ubiquinone/menaquinone biosynthesis C-methylase UbiE
MIKLNLGAGRTKMEGFINCDKAPEVNPDMIVDMEERLPFDDNSVDYIYSAHCLEHINPVKFRFVLSEIARVACDGCILELRLPFDNMGCRVNFDHYRTFNWSSFDQLCEEVDDKRLYYSSLRLQKIGKQPPKIVRWFYYLFPFLINEVHLKYKIIKGGIKNV